jgi:hypothetical protein
MSDAMTSKKLIDSVVNRGHVPINQATFDVDNFLDFATEELRLGMVPFILSFNEDYFLFEIEVPIEEGKNEYTIPTRASGIKLKDVQLRDSNGDYREMTRVTISERFNFSNFNRSFGMSSVGLRQFYIKNNKVVLLGDVSGNVADKLVFILYIKPSRLVTDEKVAIISGINRNSGVIVLDKIPEAFSTQQKFDFYTANSPYNLLKIDFSIASINPTNNTITLPPAEIPEDLIIGDHLSIANEAIIPQVPEELHVMLAQMVTCRIMESQGDTEGLQNALVKLKEMKESGGTLLDNRITDAPKKIRNRYSTLQRSMLRRFNRM